MVVLALAPASLGAQNLHRQGFWAEAGTGIASIRIGCASCTDVTRASGSGGYLRFGATISPKVLAGIEFYGFTDENFGFADGDTSLIANSGSVSAIAIWYPWEAHFFLKGGVGIAEGMFTVRPGAGQDTVVAEGTGVGLTFGFGYDLPLSRRFSLTGNAGAFITAIGDIRLPDLVVDDVIPTSYLASIGITWR